MDTGGNGSLSALDISSWPMGSSADGQTLPSVCVVTHPLSDAGENATRTLLEILAAVTTVSLITADLPKSSSIRKNHDVIEITQKDAGEGILVSALRFLLNQLRMSYQISQRSEEVILFFGATSYIFPLIVAKALGRTVLVEPRGDVPLTLRLAWEKRIPRVLARFLSGSVRFLENQSFYLADGIITYTPKMAEQLGLNPSSQKVFPSGARYVDTDRFKPTTPFEERSNVVGFLGRLDEEKGIRELADVPERLPENVRFRFIGDGDLRPWLEDRLDDQLKSGKVEITGWVDHDRVPGALNDLKLLVLPSHPTEGLPTTILEALACGTPVYATPVSGVPDVVKVGETGLHIDSRDPVKLGSGIEEFLQRDDLNKMSERARSLVEANYDFEAAKERYSTILAEVAR